MLPYIVIMIMRIHRKYKAAWMLFFFTAVLAVAYCLWSCYHDDGGEELDSIYENKDIVKNFFRRQLKIVNHFNHSIKTHPLTACKNANVSLLVLVLSNLKNVESRSAIRKTWGRSKKGVRVIFLLGYDANSEHIQKIKHESDVHKDIVQYNVASNYNNLVLKSLLGLQWATRFCGHAQFVLKTDDDMLLHLPHIVTIFSHLNKTTDVITGACHGGSKVYRSGKWKLSKKQYPFKRLPLYCSGSGYALSMDVAIRIYETAKYVPMIPIEDLYITGILGRIAGITPIELPGFPFWGTRYEILCLIKNGTLHGVHGLSPEKMLEVWDELMKSVC